MEPSGGGGGPVPPGELAPVDAALPLFRLILLAHLPFPLARVQHLLSSSVDWHQYPRAKPLFVEHQVPHASCAPDLTRAFVSALASLVAALQIFLTDSRVNMASFFWFGLLL